MFIKYYRQLNDNILLVFGMWTSLILRKQNHNEAINQQKYFPDYYAVWSECHMCHMCYNFIIVYIYQKTEKLSNPTELEHTGNVIL